MATHHKNLTSGRWNKLSLVEQLGNIGSETHRALLWQNKNEKNYNTAVERTLELFDLTLDDFRWRGRLREIARAREVFCDAISGGKEYNSSIQGLDQYLFQFALKARQ